MLLASASCLSFVVVSNSSSSSRGIAQSIQNSKTTTIGKAMNINIAKNMIKMYTNTGKVYSDESAVSSVAVFDWLALSDLTFESAETIDTIVKDDNRIINIISIVLRWPIFVQIIDHF